jgi:hypothetical protein
MSALLEKVASTASQLAQSDEAAPSASLAMGIPREELEGLAVLSTDVSAGFAAELAAPRIRGGQEATPAALTGTIDTVEDVAGTEIVALVSHGATKITIDGLSEGVGKLFGKAAEKAFGTVISALDGIRKALKRWAVKALKWVTEKVLARLPGPLATKLKKEINNKVEAILGNAGGYVGDVFGQVLGRNTAVEAWDKAAQAGQDLSKATASLEPLSKDAAEDIGRVTKIRELADSAIGTLLVDGTLAAIPEARVVYLVAIAVSIVYVCYELWDCIKDVAALV